jgi:hypothetical protein
MVKRLCTIHMMTEMKMNKNSVILTQNQCHFLVTLFFMLNDTVFALKCQCYQWFKSIFRPVSQCHGVMSSVTKKEKLYETQFLLYYIIFTMFFTYFFCF